MTPQEIGERLLKEVNEIRGTIQTSPIEGKSYLGCKFSDVVDWAAAMGIVDLSAGRTNGTSGIHPLHASSCEVKGNGSKLA